MQDTTGDKAENDGESENSNQPKDKSVNFSASLLYLNYLLLKKFHNTNDYLQASEYWVRELMLTRRRRR